MAMLLVLILKHRQVNILGLQSIEARQEKLRRMN